MQSTSKPRVIITSFPVRYAETDAMGVVHHANYLIYFEAGRSQYMRELGCDYAGLEAEGYQLPVTEVGVRYAGRLYYGQQITVQTWIESKRSRQLHFAYAVSADSSDSILVRGFTRHIWTNRQGKVTSQPRQWRQLLAESG